MRVAHLNPARGWRGGEQQLLLLMRGLQALPHPPSQVLYADGDEPLAARARDAGFEVVPFRARSSGDVLASRRLRQALRERPADLLHLHTAHAHSVGLRGARYLGTRRPAVVVSRHVSYSIYRHFPWHLTWFKYTRGIARILCVAEAVRAALRRNRIPDRLLTVVRNGVDVAAWAQEDAARQEARAVVRRVLGVPDEATLVGTVGALTPEKDHAALLEAFALLEPGRRGTHLVAVGEGPERASLVAQAAALGITPHVHVPGFQDDVATWLGALDLFVFPSRREGLPMAVLQAMAAHLPILATAVGGIPEVLTSGTEGVLVAPGDGAALSAALADLLDDPDRRAALAAAAAARAGQEHTHLRAAAETFAVYEAVVAARETHPPAV